MVDFKNATVWTGKTFEIREELKAAGGVWSDSEKTWTLPAIVGKTERMQIERMFLKNDVHVAEIVAAK